MKAISPAGNLPLSGNCQPVSVDGMGSADLSVDGLSLLPTYIYIYTYYIYIHSMYVYIYMYNVPQIVVNMLCYN